MPVGDRLAQKHYLNHPDLTLPSVKPFIYSVKTKPQKQLLETATTAFAIICGIEFVAQDIARLFRHARHWQQPQHR
jgi:hypothetical protein